LSDHQAAEVAKAGANEYLVKDSSFHHALPHLLADVIRRHTGAKRELQLNIKRKLKEQAEFVRITACTLHHEVNNPLMTILGICELILNNGYVCDAEVAKKVGIIKRSAQRVQSTLARLSAISRPSIKETVSGRLIDPQKSRISRKQLPQTVTPVE
jgi:signal transduction histidine kinase